MVARDLHHRQIVSTPTLNDGAPIRISDAHPDGPGHMVVIWQDGRGRGGSHVDRLPVGMQLDLIDGGCTRGGAR